MSESLQDSQNRTSLSMYVVDSPMGRGAGSFVYKVMNRKTKKFAALKVIGKNAENIEKVKQRIHNEIEVHSNLQHENIVTLLGHFEDKDNYYLLMEVCEGGELYNYVKKKGKLTEDEVRNFGMQFAKALKYLHNNKVLHRDLKLSNLLLTDQNVLKICDFGLAVKLPDLESERDTICGTPNYISPEIIKQEPYGIKADTWAFGCIMYAMATGSPPFEGNSVKDTLAKVQGGGFVLPTYLSSNLQDLLKKLICWDPKARFGIDDVVSHAFFAEPKLPPLYKLKSSPLESLCTSQNNSLSFGDANAIPQEVEINAKQIEKDYERAFDYPMSTKDFYNNPATKKQHKSSSAATTPTLVKSRAFTDKPPINQNKGIVASRNSSASEKEDKENQPIENTDSLGESQGESHASQFYRKRQELKKKHRAASKSIVGVPPHPSSLSQNWNSKQREVHLKQLSLQHMKSDTSTYANSKPLRIVDLNAQSSYSSIGKSSFASMPADTASSLGGDEEYGQKQYVNRKINSLNTNGLKPNKFNIKGGSLEITQHGWIILDLVSSKRKISISPDGSTVQVEKSTPFKIEKTYNLMTVPSKYIKFYTYASQVCETMRARIPRIKVEDDEGRFCLTQNQPFPNFEAKFGSGERVSHTLSSETMRIQMGDGRIYEINVLDDVSYLGEHLCSIVKKTLEKMNVCIQKGSKAN